MPQVVLAQIHQQLACQALRPLVAVNISLERDPNVLLQDAEFVLNAVIDDLLSEEDCSLRIQVELFLHDWHVDELDVHNRENLFIHFLDVLQNHVSVPFNLATDVVKDALAEGGRDKINAVSVIVVLLTVNPSAVNLPRLAARACVLLRRHILRRLQVDSGRGLINQLFIRAILLNLHVQRVRVVYWVRVLNGLLAFVNHCAEPLHLVAV